MIKNNFRFFKIEMFIFYIQEISEHQIIVKNSHGRIWLVIDINYLR